MDGRDFKCKKRKKKKKGLHNSHRQWTKFDHILCVAFFGTYLIYSSFASQKKKTFESWKICGV